MPSQVLNREESPEQAVQPALTASLTEIPLVPDPRDLPARRPGLPDHLNAPQQVFRDVTTTLRVDPEEVLIADVRSDLTPSQMVERKLLALLNNVRPSVSAQRTEGPRALLKHARSGGHPSSSRDE